MFQNYSQVANGLKNSLEIMNNLNKGKSYYKDIQEACQEIEVEDNKKKAQNIFLEKILPHLEGSPNLGSDTLKPYIAYLVILLN